MMESSGVLEATTPATVPRFEEFFEAEHVRLARALYLLTGSAVAGGPSLRSAYRIAPNGVETVERASEERRVRAARISAR